MGDTVGDPSTSSKSAKPTTILVPPRGGFLFANGSTTGLSPGPLTLISSLFPEQGSFSFSQLLAGAMASPLAVKPPAEKDGGFSVSSESSQLQPQLESLSRLFLAPPALSPSELLNSPGYLSPLQSPFGMSHQQALAHVTAQAALSQSFMQMQAELQQPSSTDGSEALLANRSSSMPNETSTQPKNPSPPEPESSKIESHELSQSDKRVAHVGGDKPVSDGYNWRKYGQKHVKNSECPRSYYKCTHVNCPVRKKVERSSDGQISEVTYKGQHNHDLPKPNKRGKDRSPSQVRTETDRLDEATTPGRSESVSFQAATQLSFEHHTVVKNKDDVEDNARVVYEGGDDDEPVTKRRSMDTGPSMAPASLHQTVTDSKIVLQTRSEVDLLDDGYKWRKYGQKVVKGNSYPRSYYRCTYCGCNVRKHVERASSDPKAVITTYEGKHNHDMPTGRYSHHQSRTQNTVSKNPSSLNQEVDCGNKDQIRPMSLQLQEGQIMA